MKIFFVKTKEKVTLYESAQSENVQELLSYRELRSTLQRPDLEGEFSLECSEEQRIALVGEFFEILTIGDDSEAPAAPEEVAPAAN